jgi:hypothetical protein
VWWAPSVNWMQSLLKVICELFESYWVVVSSAGRCCSPGLCRPFFFGPSIACAKRNASFGPVVWGAWVWRVQGVIPREPNARQSRGEAAPEWSDRPPGCWRVPPRRWDRSRAGQPGAGSDPGNAH